MSFLPGFLKASTGISGRCGIAQLGVGDEACNSHVRFSTPQLRLGQIWWVREGLLRAPCGAALSFLFKTRVSGTRTHTSTYHIYIIYMSHISYIIIYVYTYIHIIEPLKTKEYVAFHATGGNSITSGGAQSLGSRGCAERCKKFADIFGYFCQNLTGVINFPNNF